MDINHENKQVPASGENKTLEKTWEAPGELTGVTPEEAEYTPPPPPKPLPKGLFWAVGTAVLVCLAAAGIWHYRTKILPEKHFRQAIAMYEQHDYKGAISNFERVIELRPERRDTMFMIGVCYERMGDFKNALITYSDDVKYEPGNTQAWLNMGHILVSSDRHAEAAHMFERALTLSPANTAIMRSLAKSYAACASNDAASTKFYSAILKNDTDGDTMLDDSKALMELGRYQKALEGYTKAKEVLASDDKRPQRGINAARAMLGIPNDPALVIIPGKSIGPISLGDTMGDVAAEFGEPDESMTMYGSGGSFEIWTFVSLNGKPGAKFTFNEDGALIEAETESGTYKTEEGLGTGGFDNSERRNSFEITSDSAVGLPSYRYALKNGGLTFYIFRTPENTRRVAVLHKGKHSVYDGDMSRWSHKPQSSDL